MIYQFVHKRTKILPLLNFHIAHLCNQFNLVFVLLILMPPFISINFCQNKPILFAKKITSFFSIGGSSRSLPHSKFLATHLFEFVYSKNQAHKNELLLKASKFNSKTRKRANK